MTFIFSGFSVGSWINEEESYLLPTSAWRMTCRHFDWMAFTLMTTGTFSRNGSKLFSKLKLVTDNLHLHVCMPVLECYHLFDCLLQSWGDGPFSTSTEAVRLQFSDSTWNGVPLSEGVCPPWSCRTKYPAHRGVCVQGKMNWKVLQC